ncbi:MAG: HD domain-containing protein [Ignavibacteriales bacterium]
MRSIMEQILNEENEHNYTSLPDLKYYIDLLGDKKEAFLEVIRSIQRDKVYKSPIHGIYHSEKVFLFTFLLAELEGLDDIDKQILTDAAIYHDMARYDDCEETFHGYASAIRIEKVLSSPIYKNPNNLLILKAIVEGHSMSESRKYSSSFFFELEENMTQEDKERYERLYNVLKDADALDRLRFHERSLATLDASFLRLDNSIKMIQCAKQINYLYYRIIKFNQTNITINCDEHKTCYHGIGFDFFKLPSILKNGILSKDEMQARNLNVPTNFDGGNIDRWISVVDGELICQKLSAYRNFIMHGVSFECTVPKMHQALPISQKSYALLMGLPFDKSEHKDEKYVYKEIPVSNIERIHIPNNYLNANIRDLSYIFNSLSFDAFYEKIKYYVRLVEAKGIEIDQVELEESLIPYKKILNDYSHFDISQKEDIVDSMPFILEKERAKVNAVIQKWIYNYYKLELNQDEITVCDVVRHELKKAGFGYEISRDTDSVCFTLQKMQEIEEKKK